MTVVFINRPFCKRSEKHSLRCLHYCFLGGGEASLSVGWGW